MTRQWFASADASRVVDEIESALTEPTAQIASTVPALVWPLLEAFRRSGRTNARPTVLDTLGNLLTKWGDRYGLLADSQVIADVSGQCLFIQDLHCLADLHTRTGSGVAAPPWSKFGHQVEEALHRRYWTGEGYLIPTDRIPSPPAANLMPLLLLDTPPDRVAVLARRALDFCEQSVAAGDTIFPWLVAIGLQRHGLNDVAAKVTARVDRVAV